MKRLIKKLLFILPRFMRNTLYVFYNWFCHRDMLGKKIHGAIKKGKPIYYVIRPRTDCVEGLMALLLYILKQTWYADKKGYIPVVDMKNYKTQYSDNEKENAFLYFFKPKNNVSVEEAYNSENVILSSVNVFYTSPKKTDLSFKDRDISFMRSLFLKYYDFSDEALALFEKERYMINTSDCIGLLARGTDYSDFKPAGHPVQPSCEQLSNEIDRFMFEHCVNDVFLVSEDKRIFDYLHNKYKESIKTISKDSFIKNYKGDGYISNTYTNQLGTSKKSIGLQYLVKLLILSRCKYIVCGKTCGSWAAFVFSNGFTDKHVFELGMY